MAPFTGGTPRKRSSTGSSQESPSKRKPLPVYRINISHVLHDVAFRRRLLHILTPQHFGTPEHYQLFQACKERLLVYEELVSNRYEICQILMLNETDDFYTRMFREMQRWHNMERTPERRRESQENFNMRARTSPRIPANPAIPAILARVPAIPDRTPPRIPEILPFPARAPPRILPIPAEIPASSANPPGIPTNPAIPARIPVNPEIAARTPPRTPPRIPAIPARSSPRIATVPARTESQHDVESQQDTVAEQDTLTQQGTGAHLDTVTLLNSLTQWDTVTQQDTSAEQDTLTQHETSIQRDTSTQPETVTRQDTVIQENAMTQHDIETRMVTETQAQATVTQEDTITQEIETQEDTGSQEEPENQEGTVAQQSIVNQENTVDITTESPVAVAPFIDTVAGENEQTVAITQQEPFTEDIKAERSGSANDQYTSVASFDFLVNNRGERTPSPQPGPSGTAFFEDISNRENVPPEGEVATTFKGPRYPVCKRPLNNKEKTHLAELQQRSKALVAEQRRRLAETPSTVRDEELQITIDLFDYQKSAVSWMLAQERSKERICGGIISMGFGMGKTITTIGLLLAARDCRETRERRLVERKEKERRHNKRSSDEVVLLPTFATLIICPPCIVSQWVEEIEEKTEKKLKVALFAPNAFETRAARQRLAVDIDVLVVSMNMIGNNKRFFQSYMWERIVIDEVHNIRNNNKTRQAALELNAFKKWGLSGCLVHKTIDDFLSYFRFLQNPCIPSESLWDNFTGRELGKAHPDSYRNAIEELIPKTLRLLIDKYVFHKEIEANEELRQITEQLIPQSIAVELSGEERELLTKFNRELGIDIDNNTIVDDDEDEATFGNFERTRYFPLAVRQKLRRFCNHPYLGKEQTRTNTTTVTNEEDFDDEETALLQDAVIRMNEIRVDPQYRSAKIRKLIEEIHRVMRESVWHRENAQAEAQFEAGSADEEPEEEDITIVYSSYPVSTQAVPRNSVVQEVEQLSDSNAPDVSVAINTSPAAESSPASPRSTEAGNTDKIIVASSSRDFLKIIKLHLEQQGIQNILLKSEGGSAKKLEDIRKFSTNPGITVLLITYHMAVGVNLTAANHIYLMEPSWDPQDEKQVVGRIVRIGQKKVCHVNRMHIEKTIEDVVIKAQERKEEQHKIFVGSKAQEVNVTSIT